MAEPKLFAPLRIRGVLLKNRVVVAPMHQYAAERGYPTDWHLMNIGRYAAGGAGLVFVESTKVDRRGCGTVGDLGLWDDDFIPHFKRLANFIRQHDAVPAIQIGHSGRKARRCSPRRRSTIGTTGNWSRRARWRPPRAIRYPARSARTRWGRWSENGATSPAGPMRRASISWKSMARMAT